jgi:hypothetical protein
MADWTLEELPPGDKWILHTAAAGHGSAWAFGIDARTHEFGTLVFRRTTDGWRRVEVPVIGRANRAVVLSPDEVWIVGDGVSLHGLGDEWRVVPTAELPDRSAQFFGLVAFGSELWTAGFAPGGDGSTGTGTVQRWDGTEWTAQPLPAIPGSWSLAGLGGVAADDLWTVGGEHGENGAAVALHRVDGEWQRVPVPLPGQGSGKLDDVLAVASDDVWASGHWQRIDARGQRLPLVVHWDGDAWSVTDVPAGAAQVAQLAATPSGLYCVGYTDAGPYVLRWDGAAWTRIPGPPVPAGVAHCGLHGAATLPDGRLLAVGAIGRPTMPYLAVLN